VESKEGARIEDVECDTSPNLSKWLLLAIGSQSEVHGTTEFHIK